jgi:hypothetical protein
MGKDHSEEQLVCGCIKHEWSDDWCRSGISFKYCKQHDEEYKKLGDKIQQKINTLKKQYIESPTNKLVNLIINAQRDQRPDKRVTDNAYNIICPCCNTHISGRVDSHIETLKHNRKLPENDDIKMKHVIESNNKKQNIIKINQILKKLQKGQITESEANNKFIILGLMFKNNKLYFKTTSNTSTTSVANTKENNVYITDDELDNNSDLDACEHDLDGYEIKKNNVEHDKIKDIHVLINSKFKILKMFDNDELKMQFCTLFATKPRNNSLFEADFSGLEHMYISTFEACNELLNTKKFIKIEDALKSFYGDNYNNKIYEMYNKMKMNKIFSIFPVLENKKLKLYGNSYVIDFETDEILEHYFDILKKHHNKNIVQLDCIYVGNYEKIHEMYDSYENPDYFVANVDSIDFDTVILCKILHDTTEHKNKT